MPHVTGASYMYFETNFVFVHIHLEELDKLDIIGSFILF